MGKFLGTLLGQLWKNSTSLPGWVPLFLFFQSLYLNVTEYSVWILVDPIFPAFENKVILIAPFLEVWLGILTFIAYQLGDAIDKPIFKGFKGSKRERIISSISFLDVKDTRKIIEQELGIRTGIYKVAMAILKADGHWRSASVHIFNELSKFFRSLILPILIITWIPTTVNIDIPIAWRGILSLVCLTLYLVMKPRHMYLLYKKTKEICDDPERSKHLTTATIQSTSIKQFFWDGQLIVSAYKSDLPPFLWTLSKN